MLPGERRRRSGEPARFRPRAYELLALLAFAATFSAVRLSGAPLGPGSVLATLATNGPTLLAALAGGVVLNVLFRLREPGGARAYLLTVRSGPWLIESARILVAGVLLGHAYSWLKVFVPFVNGRRWDVELAWLDQALHLGISPSLFLVALFEGTPVLPLIDWSYFLWLPFALLGFGFFAAFPDRETRVRYAASHVLLWALGAWGYVAMPALGPALAFPDDWKAVRAQMPLNSGGQVTLLLNYQLVLDAKRDGAPPSPYLKPAFGVAAMPSLHVGVDVLLLAWCRRRARPLAPFVLAVLLLHLLGSVATGWHYAVDAYAGAALALFAAWAAGRLARGPAGEAPGEASAAAPPPGESRG